VSALGGAGFILPYRHARHSAARRTSVTPARAPPRQTNDGGTRTPGTAVVGSPARDGSGSSHAWPTSKRRNAVTWTPASSSTVPTVFLLSVTEGWSSRTTSL